MESKKKARANGNAEKEPVFLVKKASRFGGLDYLHIALIVLVVVLVALAFSLANFKSVIVCQYGMSVNGTCITPKYNQSQVLNAAAKVLANYQYINSTLSILTYYSLINQSKVSYQPSTNTWSVITPYRDPYTNTTLNVSMEFYGSNLSLETPFIQMLKPKIISNNSVVAQGVLGINGKTTCVSNTPEPVYLITDPYAPGAISSIMQAINMSRNYSKEINMSYKFVFSGYSISHYKTYGEQETQLLGAYLACGSVQQNFTKFMGILSNVYNGEPISNTTLYSMAQGAGFNMSSFGDCMVNAPATLSAQAELASFYGITTTPVFIANCKYEAIPATANELLNYSLSQLKG
ncbi:MAG: hypothetical protein M1544_01335 [Candidatus Marsarchaeota archaeon]|nr:hypothetical protein [Candidatus Marsarchaeota archaeon]